MLCPQRQNSGSDRRQSSDLEVRTEKVTANMVALEFGTFSKVTVPDRNASAPEARLEVSNPSAKQQEAKCLLLLMLKIGKIMWVHPDLAKDKQ